MDKTRATTGLAIAFLVGGWSLSWVVTKTAQAYCDPLLLGTLACGLGALVALLWYAVQGRMPRRPPAAFLWVAGVIGVGLFQIFAQLAVASGGAGKTILLVYSMPFWASAIAWVWLKETPTYRQKIGLCLAAVGLILVVAPWEGTPLWASILALASGLSWAVGAVATRKLMTHDAPVTLLEASTWQLVVGTVPLFVFWAMASGKGLILNEQVIGALAYAAILCGAPAWATWGLIVKRLPMAGAGLVSLLIPMCGVGWAWLFLHEQPSDIELVGMSIILAALALSVFPSAPEDTDATTAMGSRRISGEGQA